MVDWRGVWEIYNETIAILILSLGGGLIAGTVLGTEGMVDGFERFPGLLLLLPAFLATRGNVYGALGSRISSGLHQGLIEPRFERNPRLEAAIIASFINGIFISVFVGFLSWSILAILGREAASLLHLVSITFIAGFFTAFVLISGLLTLVFLGFKYGLDPDNLIGPIVTTLGDIFGVVFLFIALTVVGVIY